MSKETTKLQLAKTRHSAPNVRLTTAGIFIVFILYNMTGVSGCARTGGYSPSPTASNSPTTEPSATPSDSPTTEPSTTPSDSPTTEPSTTPSASPSPSVVDCSANANKVIFASQLAHQGNLGGTAAAAIAAADNICDTDFVKSHLPAAHKVCTFKAMIVSSVRTASPVLDWVLAPNTAYVESDGTTAIGTTTSSSIFAFSLSSPFDVAGGMVYASAWTGMKADWTADTDNCTNWTDNTFGNLGTLGKGNAVDSTSLKYAGGGCETGYSLYCVEQ